MGTRILFYMRFAIRKRDWEIEGRPPCIISKAGMGFQDQLRSSGSVFNSAWLKLAVERRWDFRGYKTSIIRDHDPITTALEGAVFYLWACGTL